MSDLVSLSTATLISESRPELHKLLRAVELSTGISYMAAYDTVTRGLEEAGAGATVRQALEAAGVTELDAISQDLTTLERADQARTRINERVTELHELDGPDRSGMTPVGHGAHTADPEPAVPIDADTYAAIRRAAPAPVYERLFQAKALVGGSYDGPRGEDHFARDDLLTAHAGQDLVGGLQRNARSQSAQQQTAQASRRLDAALAKGKSPGERRKLLDAVVSEQMKMLDAEAASAKPPEESSDLARSLRTLRELDDGTDAAYTAYLDDLHRAARG